MGRHLMQSAGFPPRRVAALLGIAAALWMAAAVVPQDSGRSRLHAEEFRMYADDPVVESEDRPERSRRSRKPSTQADGFGMISRSGYWASKSFGITDPLAHVEVMPYYHADEHFFFTDLRGFVTNYSRVGGNFGAGYRYLDPAFEGWFGGSVWYDIDDSSSRLFHQVGLSGEAVFPWFEVRTNFYQPVASRSKTFADDVGNFEFVGNHLQYSQLTQTGYSLTGWDAEIGAPLPLSVLRSTDAIRVFGGWYYFLGKEQDNISGFRIRAEGVVNNTATAQLVFTHDKQNGSQVGVGLSILMPWGGGHPSSDWDKDMPSPFRFVERNYNIILEESSSLGESLIARDPSTGDPYFFEHVAGSGSANGDGSYENPFATIGQAQGQAGGDIIFVHSDAVINSPVALNPGDRVLGDGATHTLELQGYGTTALPMLAAGGDLPVVTVPGGGPAVTLASDSEFSGFRFRNGSGDALVGQNLSNVTLHDLIFENVAGDAIRLQSLGGTSVFRDLTFNGVGGSALVVNGGSPNLRLENLDINDTGSDAVVLSNLSNALVDITSLSIDGSLGSGLVLSGNSGTIDTTLLAIADTAVDALRIQGGGADVTLNGYTTIGSDLGRGLAITGTAGEIHADSLAITGAGSGPAVAINNTTGDISINRLTVDRTGGAGLVADQASLLTILDGTLTTVGGAAFDAEDSELDVRLTSVSTDNAAYGLRLVDTDGSFELTGTGAAHSGGLIQDTTTGVVLQNAGTVQLNWLNLLNNQTGVQSNGTAYLALYRLDVQGTDGYAVDSHNDEALFIGSSLFAGNGALGGGTIRYQADVFDNYQVSLTGNAISDANGKAIQILNSGGAAGSSLTAALRNNTIIAGRDGQTAVELRWTGPLGVEVSANSLELTGSNMVGVDIAALSNISNLSATITQNTMYLHGGQSTGYRVAASATSSVEVSNNGLQFLGNNSTGFTFTGVSPTTLWLRNNNFVTTNATGSTGFLMSNLAAGSTVHIDSNTISFTEGSAVVDRGFVFTTLGNSVALVGSYDNVLTGVLQPLVIPAGQTTGGFFINSVFQQP